MGDYVRYGCKALLDLQKFVRDYTDTNGEPCTVCDVGFKRICSYYARRVDKKDAE